MPVLSQAPTVGPQNLGAQFISGLDASRSLMDRADANDRANAQAQRQQELYDVTAPLRAVTQQAEMAKAKSQIEGYGIVQEATIGVQRLVPKAIKDFTYMAQIENSQARADYALETLSRYSQLALVPELKPQFDAFNHVATLAVQDNLKVQALRAAQARANQEAKTPFSVVQLEDGSGSKTAAVIDRRNKEVTPIQMNQPSGTSQPAIDPASGEASAAQPSPQIFRSQSTEAKAAAETRGKESAKLEADKIAARPVRKAAAEAVQIRTENMVEDLDDVINRITTASAGPGGVILEKFPGTAARDVAKDLETIKSGIFVQVLQSMREASKTGGAVGNVSDKEGDRLSSIFGNIDTSQSPAQLIKNLKKVRSRVQETAGVTQRAYESEYPDGTAPASTGGATVGDSSPSAATDLKSMSIDQLKARREQLMKGR